MDELSARNKAAGNNQRNNRDRVETIIRDQPKIGRNDKVFIKNIKTGESKQVKFKQAEPLIVKGEWVIFNKN
jgi:preprotein translocase subunit SecA